MTSGLSSLLVQDQVVSVKTLEQAFRRQVIYGGLLDTNLLELNALDEASLVQYLARAAGLAAPPAWAFERVDPEALRLVAPAVANERAIVPVQVDGRSLRVLCTEEFDRAFLDHLGFTLSLLVEPWVVPELRLHQALERCYGVGLPPRFQALATKLGALRRPDGSVATMVGAPGAGGSGPVASGSAPVPAGSAPVPAGSAPVPAGSAPVPAGSAPVSVGSAPVTTGREAVLTSRIVAAGVPVAASPAPARPAPAPPPARESPLPPSPPPAAPPVASAATALATPPTQRRMRLSDETASLLAALDGESAPGSAPGAGTAPAAAPAPAPAPDLAPVLIAPAAPEAAPVSIPLAVPLASAPPPARKRASGTTAVQPGERRVGWSLADLTTTLGKASGRDEILDAALRYAGKFFEAAALFVVMNDQAVLHGTLGATTPGGEASRLASDLGRPSFLQRAAQARRFYLGVVPADDESFALLARLGRKLPRTIFVLPVAIKKRVVALVYGDNDFHQVKIEHVKDLLPMAEEVTWAFERMLISRKGSEYTSGGHGGGGEHGGSEPGPTAPPSAASGKLAVAAAAAAPYKPDRPDALTTEGWNEAPADRAVAPPEKASPAAPPPEKLRPALERPPPGPADPPIAVAEADLDPRALGDALTGSVGWGEPADVPATDDRWGHPSGGAGAAGGASGPGAASAAAAAPSRGGGLDFIEGSSDDDSWNAPPRAAAAEPRSFAERVATAAGRTAPPRAAGPAIPAPPADEPAPGARAAELEFGPPDLGTADSIAEAIIAHTDDPPVRIMPGDSDRLPIVTPAEAAALADPNDVTTLRAMRDAAAQNRDRELGHDRGDLTPEGPDLFTLIQMVDGAGAASTELGEKERAIDRLVEIGEPALRWLIERFPGKTHVDRLAFDVDELPGIEDCGDLLKAVVRFGYASVPYLMPLLIRNNVDVRFYATYAFTALPYPEAIKGLLPRLFDTDYRVRRAAIRALRGLTSAEEFDRVHEQLLRELRGTHVSRQRNAADAAAAFGFAGSVPALIDVMETGEPPAATAARQALFDLTRKDFGDSPRRWRAWWEKNAERDRREWLVEALGDKTRSIREAAIKDLQRVTGETFGFDPGEGRRVREAAMKRWRDYLDEVYRVKSGPS